MFVDEIEDCIGIPIKVSPSDLFIGCSNSFDESMMCEIYDTVQERTRHKSLRCEHEHLILRQVLP